jgi:integral membrane sensor domain MASE1
MVNIYDILMYILAIVLMLGSVYFTSLGAILTSSGLLFVAICILAARNKIFYS